LRRQRLAKKAGAQPDLGLIVRGEAAEARLHRSGTPVGPRHVRAQLDFVNRCHLRIGDDGSHATLAGASRGDDRDRVTLVELVRAQLLERVNNGCIADLRFDDDRWALVEDPARPNADVADLHPGGLVVGGDLGKPLQQSAHEVVRVGELAGGMERLHLLGEVGGMTLSLRGVTLQPDRNALSATPRFQILLVRRRPARREHRAVSITHDADVDV
jgi:hypothetical protein